MGTWIVILTTIVSLLAVLFIPKRIPLFEIYTTSFFSTSLAALADLFLDIKLRLYGFFQTGVDWTYLLIFIIVYPAFSILFLNYFPYDKRPFLKIAYILTWSIFTMLFELLSLQTDLLYYHGWKWWYSASLYPFLYLLLYLNLKITRKLANR